MVENSVGLGHASVVGAVGPEGRVELPVGKAGMVAVMLPKPPVPVVRTMPEDRLNRPVRSSPLLVNTGPVEFCVGNDSVEFKDTGGTVIDGGGAVVEFTKGVSTMVVMFVVGDGMTVLMLLVDNGGRMVERLPVEKDGTVE